MDPLFGALISGGASLLGNIFSSNQSGANQAAQIRANQDMFNAQSNFSQNMFQQAENFQQFNSNTAYTRARTDMQNAGLNPMMMFGSGGPASSPSVGVPGSPTPGASLPGRSSAMGGIGDAVSKSVNTAVALKTADATINNLVADNAKILAQTATEQQRPLLVQAETGATAARAKLADLAVGPALSEAAKAEIEKGYYESNAGKIAHTLGMAGRNINDTLSPVSNLVSSARSWAAMNASRASRGVGTLGDSFSDRFNSAYGSTR